MRLDPSFGTRASGEDETWRDVANFAAPDHRLRSIDQCVEPWLTVLASRHDCSRIIASQCLWKCKWLLRWRSKLWEFEESSSRFGSLIAVARDSHRSHYFPSNNLSHWLRLSNTQPTTEYWTELSHILQGWSASPWNRRLLWSMKIWQRLWILKSSKTLWSSKAGAFQDNASIWNDTNWS